jgi:hypothetical protein
MKWLFLLCIVLCQLLMVIPVEAATTQDVTITAYGVVWGTPSGLVITYISDLQLDLDWVVGLNSDSTMIRADYGHYPTDITDGYFVYQGAGNHAADTFVDFDEVEGIYYRAWSGKLGVWSPLYTSNFFEDNVVLIGNMLFLLGFLILPIGLTIVAFKSKIAWIMFPVVILWLVLALKCDELYTVAWDVYYIIRMMAVGMAIISGFMVFAVVSLKKKPDDILGSDSDDLDIWGDRRTKEVNEFGDAAARYRRRVNEMKSNRRKRE